ncbi:TonB-dependent receptor [Alteromonas sp. CI.11.F.A3]|uniref:TonB-dependent receptor n=1 Tax=Alteromonas sp. CI.11.F.A3 TaxID=3079555 RepID=UPI00294298AC|nr:TonB-dependent receptor [Alteromonas sp. CI.11.F.A3]WOI37132.1 TonB-dependent receptor [Alteromonas sp. CI.11.F.A3]
MHYQGSTFGYSLVAGAVFTALTSSAVVAQEVTVDEKQVEKIEVTATRRSGSLQEVPINISAITSDVLAQQNIEDLDSVARWVPGLTVTDQGGRDDSPIIVRGLNTNSSGPSSDGGTVATYFGDIPLFLNMRLLDVDRVEVLIGPQGTLYGAGTLGGAIRYIPKAVDLDFASGEVTADVFSINESDSLGGEGSFVFNAPIIEGELGIRASLNYLNNPGYLDYNYVVKDGGVSLPNPDWSDSDAVSDNIEQVKDANGEDTLTGRVAVRWVPTDDIDATLTYFYQKQDVEGRSITHYDALSDENPLSDIVGKYESAYRYEEPREREDSLLSLEVKADLGFAELVTATGFSKFEANGQRDQTDLLIRLDYSYEEFPAFSAYTEEVEEREIFTQEVRLVSQGSGPLSWIVGGFYYDVDSDGSSKEYTPNFDEYAIDVWEVGGNYRPDDLEYYSVDHSEVTEKALFGELTYELTDKWDITLGLRAYEYEVFSRSAVDLPLYYSVFEGRDSDSIVLDYGEESADDSGTLLKFNTSYQFTSDTMGYVTISEGFRIGGANSVAACPDNIDELNNQIICAEPEEQLYEADTTTNYEAGVKTSYFSNKLQVNTALFYVDWADPQVSGATVNGQQPITVNAEGAASKGVELSLRTLLSDNIRAYATYAYTKAELTADAPFLFGVIDEQGTELQDYFDGKDGDRLPGSAEHQFSLGITYSQEIFDDKMLDVNYGITAQSDIYTTVGLRQDGEALPGYAVSNLNARISDEDWSVTFYIDNLFDKYAFTSTRRNVGDIGLGAFDSTLQPNGTDIQRNYGHYLLTPRTVGLKFNYQFGM